MEKEKQEEKLLSEFAENSLKKCTAYEDGCEEWNGCPCIYYKPARVRLERGREWQ